MWNKCGKLFVENDYSLQGINIPYAARHREYEIFERTADIIISLIGLIISLPVLLLFGIAVILDTKGSAIYTQIRVGKGGKNFKIYKLRSMQSDSEIQGAKWAERNDCRVTKVGRFIRRTRIDEIPQLFNVLKGEMSIIGPRPERPLLTAEFNSRIPGFVDRLKVKPGLTGWAQVNGGYDISAEEKLKLDLYYIENRCVKMNFLILLKTARVIITGEGAR